MTSIVENAKMFRTTVCALALLSIIVAVAHGFATDSSSRRDVLVTRVDDYLARSVDNGFAGALLLAVGGKVVLSGGYGLADRAEGIPISPATVS